MSEAIKGCNICKTYGLSARAVDALKDLSFQVPHKSITAIVGPSGCGKTTLLRIIAGLLKSSSGEVLLYGVQVQGPTSRVGLVFQNPVLLPWRNVLNNVLFPMEMLKHTRDPEAEKQRAIELLNIVGLQGFESRYPFELSGGMQQRAQLARALMHDPDVLLLDEPFGALDALTREEMNLELLRIWSTKPKTILLITHDIPEAVFLADNVIVLSCRPGRVLENCRIELDRPRTRDTRYTKEFAEHITRIRNLVFGKENA